MTDPTNISHLGTSINQPSDTPYKPSTYGRTMYGENAEQARESVKMDLKNNVRVVSSDEFRKHLLFLEEDFDHELASVKNKLYKNKRWSRFPKPSKKDPAESKFYGPFVEIARAVSQACQMRVPNDAVKSDWVDCHSKAPSTLSKDNPKIRPDIVQVSASTSTGFKKVNESLREAKRDSPEKEKMSSIWWSQIHTIVEVKPNRPNQVHDLHETIIQLCSYIRQAFREQFDRRFVMAMLLCGEELTLWYCDRVGLVGTIDPLNIHEEPDEFLKILAAFSTLPAHKLGWDPTMKVYPRDGTSAVPSYTVLQERHPSTFMWSISMPSEENPALREEFITIRPLLTVCAQRICGRASMVWEAVKKEDVKACNRDLRQCPVYVLKQAWQPIDKDAKEYDGVSEVKMYGIAGVRKDRIYSYETVKTGNNISSTEFCRANWNTQTFRKAVKELKRECDVTGKGSGVPEGNTGEKRAAPDDENGRENDNPYSYIQLLEVGDNIFQVDGDTDDDNGGNNKMGLHPRVLVRILMKKHGYSLRYFVDNFELVTVLRDAVQDHKTLYDKGILHRDISCGNIVICDDDNDDTREGGMLIDLDHAKYSAQRRTVPKTAVTRQAKDMHLDLFSMIHQVSMNENVLSKIMETNISKAVAYGLSIVETQRECFGVAIPTTNDLYWPDEFETEIPDFNTHKAREGLELTGTIPFISTELVSKKRYKDGKMRPAHNAVHDMESLFWVLFYICLTREGNNKGIRRSELRKNAPNIGIKLEIPSLFEQKDGQRRSDCLEAPQEFERILQFVHPYFDCLKPLLSKLRWALRLALLYEGVERYNIHGIVLAMLDETIVKLKRDRDESMALEAKRARRKEWNDLRSTLRQIPDADEQTDAPYHPQNPGGYSPLSKVHSDKSTLTAPPASPTPRPKRKKSRVV